MKKTIRTVLFISAALLAAGCNSGKAPKEAEIQSDPEVKEILVSVATATVADVPQNEVYSSTVQANAVNNIAPIQANRIKKLNVEIGDFVTKGQILAEMDKVTLEQTRLKLLNDSTELSRVRQLYEQGGVSKSDFEAMELGYKVSRSSYENLLENTVLRSPISGVVTARNYDAGDLFAMAQPLYQVQEITPVKILVGVSESDYTNIKKGDSVSITADAVPGREFTGRVNRIYPVIDAASHTFIAEVVVPNNDRVLRPGMYVKVGVTFGVNHSVIVPDNAVVKQQGSGVRIVYVVNSDNTVKGSVVKLGRHFDNSYEILSGLEEGAVVATKGSNTLRNGSVVKIAE